MSTSIIADARWHHQGQVRTSASRTENKLFTKFRLNWCIYLNVLDGVSGKEKPSNSPAAEQQHLLIVGLSVLSALTSRRRPDFTWQEVPVCLKSSKTSPGGKTKELRSWQRSGGGKLGSRGWLGRGMGKARRDVMVSRWASTSTLPPPNPRPLSRQSASTTFGGFFGAGVCRTVLGFLRQILQICPIVFHVVGRVSAAAAAARPRRAQAVGEAVGDRPQLVHVHSSL